jgi:hypothetical protein
MLYDDAEQLEVRYVISLAHHDVSIHGLDEQIPEGELWIKRNAICLTRKAFVPESQAPKASTAPFYLFSDNLSIKEDFYFAIVTKYPMIPMLLQPRNIFTSTTWSISSDGCTLPRNTSKRDGSMPL